MAKGLSVGSIIDIPGLPGRWSVWSDHPECPGAKAVVPANDQARGTGVKYAVVRVTWADSKPFPDIDLRHTDPPLATLPLEGRTA